MENIICLALLFVIGFVFYVMFIRDVKKVKTIKSYRGKNKIIFKITKIVDCYYAEAFFNKKFFGKTYYGEKKYEDLFLRIKNNLSHIERLEVEGYEVRDFFSGLIYREDKKFHLLDDGTCYECVSDPNFPRAEDDGRCLACEGWGCCACGHSGGY